MLLRLLLSTIIIVDLKIRAAIGLIIVCTFNCSGISQRGLCLAKNRAHDVCISAIPAPTFFHYIFE